MYDMHYDLLTILYYNFKKNNRRADIFKLFNDCCKIYSDNNIIGGIVNLYFMSSDEMYREIGITSGDLLDVKLMFKKSISYLEFLKDINIIPKNTSFLYSIEGCDYLNSCLDLEELYEYGLRAILPVWNNKNKFASGLRSDSGITSMGVELVNKALELGIAIDVSHANKKSFHDFLDIVERYSNYTLLASHSNVRKICNRSRNLDDDELVRLREMNGYIGLFTNSNFLSLDNKKMNYNERQEMYIRHLDYLINKIGVSVDRILVSTDDMNFHPDCVYHNIEAFPIECISRDLHKVISNYYDEELAYKIMVDNPRRLINKVKKR